MFLDQAMQSQLRSVPMPAPAMPPQPPAVNVTLTEREREVLGLAGQGLSNKGIAQALGISSGTVTWHLKNCYQKYGVNTREQALRKARVSAQIRPISTSICTCGRVHTFWGTDAISTTTKAGEQA